MERKCVCVCVFLCGSIIYFLRKKKQGLELAVSNQQLVRWAELEKSTNLREIGNHRKRTTPPKTNIEPQNIPWLNRRNIDKAPVFGVPC